MAKLYVVGIGPGGLSHMTLEAREALAGAQVVVGDQTNLTLITPRRAGQGAEPESGNQGAVPRSTWLRGPPCMPGKTARSTACAGAARHRMKPDRGPASVLCVVEVTKSQCSTGFGWRPAATSPAMWAMSTIR